MKNLPCFLAVAVVIGMTFLAWVRADSAPTTTPSSGTEVTTLKNVKIEGSLDLENSVPIRWKKPDGSGYINIFMLDKTGTLQLCRDPYYWDAGEKGDRLFRPGIEMRNPQSEYPDFWLPVTRNRKGNTIPGREVYNADSKLVLRSLNLIETNDPSEINLARTGTDDPNNVDDDGVIGDGAVTGLIRWLGRRKATDAKFPSGFAKVAELIGRSYGTSPKESYGALVFQVQDFRFPEKGATMLVMKSGVRIGDVGGDVGDSITGAAFEVDSPDDKPVLLRRSRGAATQPVALAFANGKTGTPADAENTLGLIKAQPFATDGGSQVSRLEIQTNKGKRLETDWVLPVPAAQVSRRDAQKVPSGSLVALAFDQVRYDNDLIFDAAKGQTKLTCRTAGRYAVAVSVEFAANGKGSRQVIIRRNGRDQIGATRVPAVTGESTQITFTAPPVALIPGDYLEVLVRQTSGEVLEVPATAELPITFSITRSG